MTNFWSKKLSRTDLGLGGTHDQYLNIPKSSLPDPKAFFEKSPGLPRSATNPPSDDNWKFIELIDKKTERKYRVRYEWARVSKQTRLYELRECYEVRNAKIGDDFLVEKAFIEGKTFFFVDILRSNKTTILPLDEVNKQFQKNKKPKFKPKFNPASKGYRSGKYRKKTDIIEEAEIYKVTFSIENKKYVYVGQDSFCAGENWYFGSSLVIHHYEEVFGRKIFNKKILLTVKHKTLEELNSIERKHILESQNEAKSNGWHSVNYN
ncbi:MAG: hypothetical protein CMM92_00880 [Rickettsiales bacterium]|nr:hypothetical protein [Rickettsiales bacterium]RPG16000.1 MAG: hypothetical protein CBD55_000885 [Pelagibacteraceae bacterium TMED195]|tara:strand:- start:43 stop:834 length:792 start_codon:yes stop_codon:yes gene_type:complete